jgi:hypothetical protein
MTTTEILALANKALQPTAFTAYSKSLNERKFTAIRIIAEICLEKAKDVLIANAIREYCDPAVTSQYKVANDLMNETLEFIIVNSDVN